LRNNSGECIVWSFCWLPKDETLIESLFCEKQKVGLKRNISKKPSSERDVQECDTTGDDSSTGDNLIIINKFTFLVAFQFQIIKFNNFRFEND
jgi:hypothetical protein